MHILKPVTDDDEWKLIRQLSFLQEILNSLRFIHGTFSADPLHLITVMRNMEKVSFKLTNSLKYDEEL